ncbi:MAG: cytochrome P450 [Myxococcota bacterium]
MSLPPFHPFSLDYTADPRPWFREAHRDNRILEVPELGAVAVHGYEAVRSFCDHPQMSRNPLHAATYDADRAAERLERWPLLEGSLTSGLERGEEGLSLMRELLAPDFRPAMIRKMAATVQDVVAKVLAPIQFERELDLVRLVREVPLIVITKLLGLDEATEDSELFLNAAPDYFRGINPIVPDDARDRAELAARRMTGVLERAVENRRARPRTDMVSQVLEIADGIDDATTEDVIRALVILVAAGTDTTRLTSSLAVKTLLNHPEEFERLRADRSLVKNAVMELLRYESPTKFLVRIAMDDVEWEGQTIRKGSLVLLSIFGAGWDPRVFAEPERFDVRRDLKGSLSFGFGSGYCLGVHLARLQVGEILGFYLDHLPSTATLDPSRITWDPMNLMLREVTSLPVRIR